MTVDITRYYFADAHVVWGNMSESKHATMDMYEEKAMMLVEQLIEKELVKMPSDEPILVHVPTGAQFSSAQNLAHYHSGWKAGTAE